MPFMHDHLLVFFSHLPDWCFEDMKEVCGDFSTHALSSGISTSILLGMEVARGCRGRLSKMPLVVELCPF